MGVFDYKTEWKELYSPKADPGIVEVPGIWYAAVRGEGNPNEDGGEYSRAVGILYALSYTIKMSYKGSREIDGYFEYVVPPLEGFWWMGDGTPGIDYGNKSGFQWIAMIRLPEFVTEEVFEWAKEEAARKKKMDMGPAERMMVEEGLCVQCMHTGSYDEELETVRRMELFLEENGYRTDISGERRHHEIYLKDPRKTAPEKLKTVIRHPVVKV